MTSSPPPPPPGAPTPWTTGPGQDRSAGADASWPAASGSPYTLPAPPLPGQAVTHPMAGPPPPPGARPEPQWQPGTNGLAIAALWCGIGGFLPFASLVAIVLGIVALTQLRRVAQQGRGLAIAGIVLGSLWVLAFVAFIAFVVQSGADRDAAGALRPGQSLSIGDLRAGDCFDGLPAADDTIVAEVVSVTCADPHEAQVAATPTLAVGPWPGREKAALWAESTCSTSINTLVRVEEAKYVQLVYLYPSSETQWSFDRGVACLLVDADGGHLVGSVLNPT